MTTTPIDREGLTRRRAKIVCTLGPATESPEGIAALVAAGMDVARLNFSHGTREEHAAVYARVREASAAAGRAVGLLADLGGPKIRLESFDGGFAVLEAGAAFTVSAKQTNGGSRSGSSAQVDTTYAALATDVAAGDTVLIDDGMVKLRALSSVGLDVACEVVEGGLVSDHKGINLPGVAVSAPALTDKDIDDLRFALELGVDTVALSFVRRAEDAHTVTRIMDAAGRRVPIIAKLEKPEAIDDLDAIVDAFDGLMVARGDLGVEIPMEQVPLVQKRAIRLARDRCKPVIVATQMLESMIHRSRPTRAEVSDVANAVLDGADALMLSAETSVGDHAIAAVATMARIIAAAEEQGLAAFPPLTTTPTTRQEAISQAAPAVGHAVQARALVAFTQTGSSARRLASHRPPIPVLAFTPDAAVRNQLALTWGVETFVVPVADKTDAIMAQVDRAVLDSGHSQVGDVVVIVAGRLAGQTGSTDMMRVHELGSA